jgi:glucokinase
LRGIGIGAPSIVLWGSGTVVWAASLGWRDLPLKSWIQEQWNVPVFVENDVNLLALGESWRGAGQQAKNLAVIAVGTGIGAGLILNGKLFRGANEAAGEIGYLPPGLDALEQTYTGYGPLEALAAGPGLVRRAIAALEQGAGGLLSDLLGADDDSGQPLSPEKIYWAARQRDPLAQQLVEETAGYLSMAVAGLAVVLNPEMILLGGEMARAADLLLEPIRRKVVGLLPVMPRLEPVALGDDGVIVGATALVLRNTSPEIAGMRGDVLA